jgi:hypothetical protein
LARSYFLIKLVCESPIILGNISNWGTLIYPVRAMTALQYLTAVFAAVTGALAAQVLASQGTEAGTFRNGTVVVLATAVVAAGTLTVEEQDTYLTKTVPGGTAPQSINISRDVAYVTFNVTGEITLALNGLAFAGADGNPNIMVRCRGANKIAPIICAGGGYLTGVFVNSQQHYDEMAVHPTALDFTDGADGIGTDFSTLSPPLNAMFFVGDGKIGRGNGDTQRFDVPANATILVLGIADCSSGEIPGGYSENSGEFNVAYTMWPPETCALLTNAGNTQVDTRGVCLSYTTLVWTAVVGGLSVITFLKIAMAMLGQLRVQLAAEQTQKNYWHRQVEVNDEVNDGIISKV